MPALRLYERYAELFESHRPALVINGGNGLHGKLVSLLCREKGVPHRILAQGRLGDTFYWSIDEFDNAPELDALIRAPRRILDEDIAIALKGVVPPPAFRNTKAKGAHMPSLWRTLHSMLHPIAHYAYGRIRGYREPRVGYKPLSKSFGAWRAFTRTRVLERSPYPTLEGLPTDSKLVFLPLQIKPEVSLQGQSPEYGDQVAMVQQVALSLPSDNLFSPEPLWI